MKKRTIRHIAAALAALMLAAGYTAAGNEAAAQDAAFWNPLAGLSEYLQQRCEDAWYASSASQTCVFHSGGVAFSSSNWNRCELTGVYCEVARGFWHHNYNWWGSHEEIGGLANCNGLLRPGPC